jgi:transposase InsO family protein
MLDFLWSKSGRTAAEASADPRTLAVAATGTEPGPASAALDEAGCGRRGIDLPAADVSAEPVTISTPPPANPPSPPGGPAEFTRGGSYGQAEVVAGAAVAGTGTSPPTPSPHWTDADPELLRLDGWPKPSAAVAISGLPGAAPDPLPADAPPHPEATGVSVMPDTQDRPADTTPPVVSEADVSLRRYQRRAAPGRRLVKKDATATPPLTAEQRLLLLDTWRRSGLPAGDFAALIGISKHTLYAWKKKFDQHGPAGLLDQPRGGPKGSKLPDLTKRTILLLKETNPTWGCQKISDLLLRGPALPASPSAVACVLHEAGYELEEVATRPHPDHVRSFERAKPNQLWQTDLFTFVLKRQNRRVYLVAFLDDHSRFIVGYGLHASQSSALVLEVLRAAIASYGTPEEILTDNGSQYVTWRGKSVFTRELDKRGIKQIVAAPRRPQTLGKIERFWGTLWRECLDSAVFLDLGDAQRRIGLFMDHYNFQRCHSRLGGLVPADRFFGAAAEVKQTLQARVAANALELAKNGVPRPPFYLTGQVGGHSVSVHAEGERVILTGAAGRQEVDLVPPPAPVPDTAYPEPVCPAGVLTTLAQEGQEQPLPPGQSPLDDGLSRLRQTLPDSAGGQP